MSNLPPGVTGNEYQIAGPDFERDESRECPSEGFTIKTTTGYGEKQIDAALDLILDVQKSLRGLPVRNLDSKTDPYRITMSNFVSAEEVEVAARRLTAVTAYLRTALSEVETVDVDGECPFAGDVTVQGYNGVVSWECPVCRTTHEEEID